MKWLIIFLLLWLKHGLLANALDWGYSASRRERSPWYLVSLARHLTLEALLTLCLLSQVSVSMTIAIVSAEVTVQLLGCLIERQATLFQQLRRHLLTEMALIVTYFAMVLLLPFLRWLLA